jgi:hypothetical protein
VIDSALRGIAGVLLAVLTGLPIAGTVCAWQCAMPHELSSHDASAAEHCGTSDSAGAATLGDHTGRCSLIALGAVATRERTAAHASSPIGLSAQPRADIDPQSRQTTLPRRYAGSIAGLSPGTSVPLRI